MTEQYYDQLENGPMYKIDAAIWSGNMFHNRENIAAFRDMMSKWDQGLQSCEELLNKVHTK